MGVPAHNEEPIVPVADTNFVAEEEIAGMGEGGRQIYRGGGGHTHITSTHTFQSVHPPHWQ